MKLIEDEKTKKDIIFATILILIAIFIFYIMVVYQNNIYKKTINITIKKIINEVKKEYPNVSEEELIKVLVNSKNNEEDDILKKYGYTDSILSMKSLENSINNSIIANICFIFTFGVLGLLLYIKSQKHQQREVEELLNYLNEINNKNYELKIDKNNEDKFSKLRNELYKTTVLLKEVAENSEKEKNNLSNALADMSHQIKTPITSIRIMLDNINENPNMEEETKKDFMMEISKQVDWISSIIIALLKLAKFDAGVIRMNDSKVNLKDLINAIISNLSIMLEVKNIKVITNVGDNLILNIDYKWQLEALTNILKNSIEHSKENSKIYIEVENSSVFTKIKIKDEGEGIDKKDLKHIFERFYKSKGSKEDSIGIGLSLAKTIIEKDGGYIMVDSEKGKETVFTIKYFK